MSEQKRVRESIAIVGLEQTGKTYYTEQAAKRYISTGRSCIAYNVGKPTDFSGFEEIQVLTPDIIAQRMEPKEASKFLRFPKIDSFLYKGKQYHFCQFRKMFSGKGVKIYRINQKYERHFYKCLFEHVFDTLIIFDDFRPCTRQGMGHELIELVSRKNHCGHRYTNEHFGNDIFFIYHNLDHMPPTLWDYITSCKMFKLNRMAESMDNPEFKAAVLYALERLKTLPKFSHVHLQLRNVEKIQVRIFSHKTR